MTHQTKDIGYESVSKKALEQFRSGKGLLGKEGALAPLFKEFLEAALAAEMEEHLKADESGNRRNGQTSKTVKTGDGQFELITSRDRNSSFEPQIIKKRETVLAYSLQDRIIGMYGLEMSLRNISSHIKEMYDVEIFHGYTEWHYRPDTSVNKRVAEPPVGRCISHCMDGCNPL